MKDVDIVDGKSIFDLKEIFENLNVLYSLYSAVLAALADTSAEEFRHQVV